MIDEWGRVIFHGEDAVELLLRDNDITTLLFTPDATIADYNLACQQHNKLEFIIPPIAPPDDSPETDTQRRLNEWFMPEKYRTLPVRDHLLSLCQRPDEVARVNQEIDLFEKHRMIPVLRLMFFLVDHFRRENIVWGVGRGSSVASYCLFLIGVHKIDAIAYRLPIEDFLR